MADFGNAAQRDGDGDSGTLDARFVFDDGSAGDDGSSGGSSRNGRSSGDDSSSDSAKRAKRNAYQREYQRKRREGGTTKTPAATEASVSASIDGLTGALLLLHFGIANGVYARTKNPALAGVFAINREEARAVAEPAAALMTRYVGKKSEDAQLWVNLTMSLVALYGGKLAGAMMQGKQHEQPAASTPTH